LRYDVVVRRDFFELLDRHREMYLEDRPRFDAMAERHPYVAWFRHVNCAFHHPEWSGSEERFGEALARRVDRNHELLESVSRWGFRDDQPIMISTSSVIRRTATGKDVRPRRWYLSDGAHRIGLLMWLGHDLLLPSQYVLGHRREFAPPDNTSLLLPHIDVPEPRYVEFLSWGYLPSPVADRDELFRALAAQGADVVDEVRQLVRIDGMDGSPSHDRGRLRARPRLR
jgi:hypothetical protein